MSSTQPDYRFGNLTGANYKTYKSPYGPRYSVLPNVQGWTARNATKLGITLGAFGGVTGIFALFFFGEVPRIRRDILSKVPFIGDHFIREIPPSDNFGFIADWSKLTDFASRFKDD